MGGGDQGSRAEIQSLVEPERIKAREEGLPKFEADVQQAVRLPDAERTAYQRQIVYQALKYSAAKERDAASRLKDDKKKRYDELKMELTKFDNLKPQALPTAQGITDAAGPPPPTFRLAGGSFKHPAEQVQPGFPKFLGACDPNVSLSPGHPETTGRRAALANWLTRKDHPLTARLIVNRLWQGHFGQGIVATPNDFGTMGEPATHPELLDWLAVELMESGWSLKAMHRLMVTSATYQQSALVDAKNELHAKATGIDPSDKLLWRARRQRLSGEALRDAVLSVSGDLDTRMYGPSVHPDLPDGLGNYAWKPDARAEDRNRRSIYVMAKRNLRLPLLDAFDLPDMHNSCARRSSTTTSPQALLMLNSEFTLGEARCWSGRLISQLPKEGHDQAADDRALIAAAYGQAYGRQPTSAELDLCAKFIIDQAAAIEQRGTLDKESLPVPPPASQPPAHAAAIVDFCHALLNSNEFLYVD